MILRVLRYDTTRRDHICEDIEKTIIPHAVDLKIWGDLGNVPNSALVGKFVEVEGLQHYTSIGIKSRCVRGR
jgi:hypothetical protein